MPDTTLPSTFGPAGVSSVPGAGAAVRAPALPGLLQVRDLQVSYGRFGAAHRVLDNVSLNIAAGEAVGLIGESGSGKTTLAKVVLGALRPQSGSVGFDGRDLSGLSARELRRFRRGGAIQYVFQDPLGSLDPEWSVFRSIEEPLHMQGVADVEERRRRVREAYDRVGLPAGLLDRLPAQLSGGQRQRVVIARALVCRPRLLIADEPVSALDASARAHVLDLFATLRRDAGLAQLFISHDLGSVAGLVDRIVVLRQGRIVESGSPAQIIRAPVHPYTRELVQAAPRLRR